MKAKTLPCIVVVAKEKKYTQKKIDSKPRMVHSLSSVGEISKGRQLRGNKSGLKKKKNRKKPTDEIKHDINK